MFRMMASWWQSFQQARATRAQIEAEGKIHLHREMHRARRKHDREERARKYYENKYGRR